MPTIRSIISRGYLLRELPPAFTTDFVGGFFDSHLSVLPACFDSRSLITKTAAHNLARSGSLRRRMGIPNVISFYQLVRFVVEHWDTLISFARRSHLSLTIPVDCASGRAIDRQFGLNERAAHRIRIRSTSRYILQTDISRFYHSIYTHSIPWAMHTKAVAKSNRGDGLLGNVLDRLIRISQDGQTMGIPIGPDTSLLIAEIILSAIDVELVRRDIRNGFRYIDDYEIGFATLAAAEQALGVFQEVLEDYELALNPNKTNIIKLPLSTEHAAISEIRNFLFRLSVVGQQSDILRFFDRAFVLSRDDPGECILRFAVSRLSGLVIHQENWQIVEGLLLQCVMNEPGAIKVVLNQFLRYRDLSYHLNRDRIAQVLNALISQHAPFGHGSEVAWGIWAMIVLNLSFDQSSAVNAAAMNDSVVALLLLDANSKRLLPSEIDFNHYASFMTTEDLHGEQWLLSYEANIKGWLPSVTITDHVNADECFSFLKSNGVFFYNDTLSSVTTYEDPEGWTVRYE
jgi:hypothetical protein